MSTYRIFECTKSVQVFTVPRTGYFRIECYGAQGGGKHNSGNSQSGTGGRGGYANGIVYLEKSYNCMFTSDAWEKQQE